MLYTKEQIMDFIPHRDPFLFLDRIDGVYRDGVNVSDVVYGTQKELAGLAVKAVYEVKEDHSIFEGHFPGNPILPGVVQVEMMAQAACFIAARRFEDPFSKDIEVALLGVNDSRFRKPVTPEMVLNIEVICTNVRGPMMSFRGKVFNETQLVSESTLLASLKIN